MKKIKILYVIDKMDIGGTQRHLLEILQNINRDTFEVSLCCLVRIGALEPELKKLKISYKAFNIKRIYGISGIKGIVKLISYIKENQFDIVHTLLFSANIAGNIAAKLAKAPLIISGRRDVGIHREGRWQHRIAYRFAHKLADMVFAVSDDVQEIVHKYEGVEYKKILTICNGIDIKNLKGIMDKVQLRKKLGIEEAFVVGIVASLTWVKGHKLFIEAARLVLEEMPNVKFLIVGNGPLKDQLMQQADSLCIKDKIIFLGIRTDVKDLYGLMDVSVNASFSEGMSNAILESMALGTPVVATSVGGNKELIKDSETGFLVGVGDALVMKDKIVYLLKNRSAAQQIAENAKKIVEQNFSLNAMISGLENAYTGLLSEKSYGYYCN
ncbi:MAG: glycosyltransferase [Candidatus Omnitrophota bacterium]